MQSKKRAKPVKFGRKPEQPNSAANIKQQINNLPDEQVGLPTEEASISAEESTAHEVNNNRYPEKTEHHDKHITVNKEEKEDLPPSVNEHSKQHISNPVVHEPDTEKPAGHQKDDIIKPDTANTALDTNAEADTNEDTVEDELPSGQWHTQEAPKTQEELSSYEGSDIEHIKHSDSQAPTLGGDTYVVEKEAKKSILGYFLLIALISFLIGLISMAAVNFFQNKSLPGTGVTIPFLAGNIKPSPTPEPTAKPSPTPETVNPAEYSIKILNGSGVTGAATKLKQSLTNSGYNVISAGNADISDLADTTVSSKKGIKPIFLTQLKNELKKTYSVTSGNATAIADLGDADVVITIGINLASKSAQ